MKLGPNSDLCRLLLRLHREEATGVIVLKQGERQLALYVKGGDIVYAAGVDKESLLLREIASGKKLNREELALLHRLIREEPLSFGKALLERNLISKSRWLQFLEEKVRDVLAAALDMEDPDILVNQSELGILPVNFVACPIPALLLEEIRKTKDLKRIQDYLVHRDPLLCANPDGVPLKGAAPLTPSEARLLSALDGVKGSKKLIEETGTTLEALTRDLHVLFSLGLIKQSPPLEASKESQAEYKDILLLYLSLLRTMKHDFQDKEFREMVRKCLDDTTGPVKTLFHDLALDANDEEVVVGEVLRRFSTLGSLTNRRLVLLTAFNKLIYLLLVRIKKKAGKSRTDITLERMMKTLLQAEESKKHPDLMLYLLGNLEDYAKQMGSR